MRLLVCGGRTYDDAKAVYRSLDTLNPDVVIHGGANGADTLADNWAEDNGKEIEVFEADWDRHGRAAGPIRNQAMLDEGRPDAVLAFPGGPGTEDMIARAKRAGLHVYQYVPPQ